MGSETRIDTRDLTASVGAKGKNHQPDVERVQALLLLHGQQPGNAQGICDAKTVAAIERFQRRFMAHPDGRIDVGGRTWRALIAMPLAHKSPQEAAAKKWSGDPARWSKEQKLESLNPAFREKVERLLKRVKDRGFKPKVVYGWRSVAIQLELHNKGRSKVKFSFHNAQLPNGTPNAYAVDIVDERWGWSGEAEKGGFWKALGEEANTLDLVWGGDWKSFKDVAHVQGRKNSELRSVKTESGL